MSLPSQVFIRELGPREGFQTISKVVPTADKIKLIEMLSESGLKEIEVTSFVRPDKVPQMADAELVVAGLKNVSNVKYTALYLNEEGFKRCEATKRLANQGWIYIAASETFLKKNNNTTVSAVVDSVPAWIKLFDLAQKSDISVMISTAFGCNYEGAIPESKALKILEELVVAIKAQGRNIREISLADTMGHASPRSITSLVTATRKRFPESEVSLHLHDTRGSGMANVYAGLEIGVTTFDCSIGGMGGCPFAKGAAGNVCTEDVAYLCESLGIKSGIDLGRAVKAAKFAEKIIGATLPGKLYKTY